MRQVKNHPNNVRLSAQLNFIILGALPPVDFLPFLKYLPTPLASWKPYCENIRRLQRKLYFGHLKEVEQRLAHGQENDCFMEQVSTLSG